MIREANNVVHIAVQALLILCLAAPLTAQTNEWKKYERPEGNFSVRFPGEPKEVVNGVQERFESHSLLYTADGPVYYAVVYTSMKDEQKVDEATYLTYKQGVFNQLQKCSEVSSSEASPAFPGYIGHVYRLDCDAPNANAPTPKGTLVVNLYFGRHFAYAIVAGFAITPDPPTIKKFTDSFSVTDISK